MASKKKDKENVGVPQQAPKRLDPLCITKHPQSRGKLIERKKREWAGLIVPKPR